MDWKEAITEMCNTTLNEIDMVVKKIESVSHKKPVFVLKVYSDNTYSCYIEKEQEKHDV